MKRLVEKADVDDLPVGALLVTLLLLLLLLGGCTDGAPLPTLLPTAPSPQPTASATASSAVPPGTYTPAASSGDVGVTPTIATSEATATPNPAHTPTPQVYEIQPGDDLWSIAVQFQVEFNDLLAANGLTGEASIFPGHKLIIPPPSETALDKLTVPYRVQPGETFISIASDHGISPETLMAANPGIVPEALQAEQVIRVPWDGVYVTESGDTLSEIAWDFQVNYDELVQENADTLDLDNPDLIYPGMTLIIPRGGPEVVDCSPQEPRREVFEYTVKAGERIFCLSRKFGVSVPTIIYANPSIIGTGELTEGSSVRIPPADGAIYTITEDDVENEITLEDIARWYSMPGDLENIVDWQGRTVTMPVTAEQQLFLPGADLLSTPFNSNQLVAYYEQVDATGADASGEVSTLPPADAPPGAATFGGTLALFWNDKYAQDAPGYCPYLVGSGWQGGGPLTWPIDSREIKDSRGFRPGHEAIDLPSPEGAPVYAAESGIVIYSGQTYFMGGKVVILAHGNGWRTTYAHLSATYVACGQSVARGTTIALSGQTGTGWPHLHFAVHHNGTAYNPLRWLR